jgi:hypothetical protein
MLCIYFQTCFCLPPYSNCLSGNQPPVQWTPVYVSVMAKQQEHEACCSPPSGAKSTPQHFEFLCIKVIIWGTMIKLLLARSRNYVLIVQFTPHYSGGKIIFFEEHVTYQLGSLLY